MPFEASPVAAYYCMLFATKSYLTFKIAKADDFVKEFAMHGISEAKENGADLESIKVKHKNSGVFPLFASTLDSDFNIIWPKNKSVSLKSLLYNLAFVHRTYSMTYTTQKKKVDELFLPLSSGDMPKYYKGSDGKTYLKIDLDRTYFAANASTIPNQTILTITNDLHLYGSQGFTLISGIGSTTNKTSISSELKLNNARFRKYFSYIYGSKRMWYLKRSNFTSDQGLEILNLSDLTINMAIMHRISEIARYKPEQLNRLMKSKENWLLHEFINKALDQFIDELACEITGLDIMSCRQK